MAGVVRTFHHGEFSTADLADARVSVCLPARNEATRIARVLEPLIPLREQGLVHEVLVLDQSTDGTAAIAEAAGATVHDQDAVCAELGPAVGKGDAMWRALHVATGDIIVFMDADSEWVDKHYVVGLAGAVASGHRFVKGFYRRPAHEGRYGREGGGRVTELTAKPLLRTFFPELADVRQPLAGEIAGTRDLLRSLEFTCGYGVDIGLLLDAYGRLGASGIAQVDLEVRGNPPQHLHDLSAMADAVLTSVCLRLAARGVLTTPVAPVLTRPAVDSYVAAR